MGSIKKYIFLLSISFSFLSVAQNKITISGTITDSSGKPIPQAIVAFENTTKGTYSNEFGRYSLKTSKGWHVLVVSAFGYKVIKKQIDITQTVTLDFKLEENSVSLETVEVFGKTYTEQFRDKALTAKNIDVRPIAATINELSTLLTRSSGVHIRTDGGVGADFNLSINGLSGNAIRYFIDGVPLSTLGSGVSVGNMPVNLIERLEIYKGVVPAELGEDALGGAINIITKNNKENYLNTSVGAGSFGTYRAGLDAQYIDSKTGFTVRPSLNFSYSKNNYIMRDVEVWDEQEREYIPKDMRRFHNRYKSVLGRLEAGFVNKSWADEAFVTISYSADDKEIQTGQKQTIVIGEATRSKNALNIGLRYAKRNFLTKNLSTRLYLSHTNDYTQITDTAYRIYAWDGTWVNTSFSEVTGREKSIRRYKRPLTIGRVNLNYIFNSNNVTNLNYMFYGIKNKREDDFDKQFIPTNDVLEKHTIGLTHNLHLFENRLHATLFVKDYIFHSELKQQDLYWITGVNDVPPSATKNHIGYGLGSRYSLSPLFSIKTSYERSVRLPTSREFLGNGQTIYPNFKLKPETSHNINVGAFGEFKPLENHSIYYEMNFFVRDVKDYILRTVVSDRQSQFDNIGAAKVNGLEGEISYHYNDNFRMSINGTYVNERNKTQFKIDGITPEVTYNNRMPNRPWLYTNAELSWNKNNPFGFKNNRLKLDYVFSYIHWFYLTWEAYGSKLSKEIIPSQYINDIALTWFFANNKYSLSVECTNIFDRKLYDNYMLQKPGRAFFTKLNIFIN